MSTLPLVIGLAAAVAACSGGGGSGGGTPTSPTGVPAATITIGGAGVSPNVVRIDTGQMVRFTNSSSRSVEMHSDPHPTHETCPPLNEVGVLTSGQSRMSGVFTRAGTCTYHDHNRPEDGTLRGTILVAVSEPGPGPVYRTH